MRRHCTRTVACRQAAATSSVKPASERPLTPSPARSAASPHHASPRRRLLNGTGCTAGSAGASGACTPPFPPPPAAPPGTLPYSVSAELTLFGYDNSTFLGEHTALFEAILTTQLQAAGARSVAVSRVSALDTPAVTRRRRLLNATTPASNGTSVGVMVAFQATAGSYEGALAVSGAIAALHSNGTTFADALRAGGLSLLTSVSLSATPVISGGPPPPRAPKSGGAAAAGAAGGVVCGVLVLGCGAFAYIRHKKALAIRAAAEELRQKRLQKRQSYVELVSAQKGALTAVSLQPLHARVSPPRPRPQPRREPGTRRRQQLVPNGFEGATGGTPGASHSVSPERRYALYEVARAHSPHGLSVPAPPAQPLVRIPWAGGGDDVDEDIFAGGEEVEGGGAFFPHPGMLESMLQENRMTRRDDVRAPRHQRRLPLEDAAAGRSPSPRRSYALPAAHSASPIRGRTATLRGAYTYDDEYVDNVGGPPPARRTSEYLHLPPYDERYGVVPPTRLAYRVGDYGTASDEGDESHDDDEGGPPASQHFWRHEPPQQAEYPPPRAYSLQQRSLEIPLDWN